MEWLAVLFTVTTVVAEMPPTSTIEAISTRPWAMIRDSIGRLSKRSSDSRLPLNELLYTRSTKAMHQALMKWAVTLAMEI